MRTAFLALLTLLASATAVAQQPLTGTYKSDELGLSVTMPKGWKFVVQGDSLLAGHDTEAGLLVVSWDAGATVASLKESALAGFEQDGFSTRAKGPAKILTLGKNKAVAADFEGMAVDGTPVAAAAIGVVGPRGAVNVLGITDVAHIAGLKKRVDQVAKSVRFTTPKQPAVAAGGKGAGALRGSLCSYSGGSVMSRTSRANFDGAGHVSLGSEVAIGGSLSDQYGNETGRYVGGGGNQYAPSDGGTYSIRGDRVDIRWGDGSSTACKVNMRQSSGAITELMCDGKLYATGLCE